MDLLWLFGISLLEIVTVNSLGPMISSSSFLIHPAHFHHYDQVSNQNWSMDPQLYKIILHAGLDVPSRTFLWNMEKIILEQNLETEIRVPPEKQNHYYLSIYLTYTCMCAWHMYMIYVYMCMCDVYVQMYIRYISVCVCVYIYMRKNQLKWLWVLPRQIWKRRRKAD